VFKSALVVLYVPPFPVVSKPSDSRVQQDIKFLPKNIIVVSLAYSFSSRKYACLCRVQGPNNGG
jgi:hypothetical protein